MFGKLEILVRSTARWLLRRPAYMLLTADDSRLAEEPPGRFALAWAGLMGLSVVWGVVLVNLWGVTWIIFRDYDPLIMPAAATAALFALWASRRSIASLADLIGGRDASGRAVAAAALVLVVGLCLARLGPDWQRFEPRLPWWLEWLRPPAKLYRVLLLMPVWGAWSMVVTVQFCKPTERTEPQVSAFARGCGAAAAAACMALPLAGSLLSFQHLGQGGQTAIPLVTLAAAIASGIALCLWTGGLTRRALLAANFVTQIAFVLTYLGAR